MRDLVPFLLLPLALACSADWKNGSGGPGDEADATDSGDSGPVGDGGGDTDTDTDTGDTGEPTGDPSLDLDQDGDGYTPNQGDCDDADPTVYPGAPELCDDKDNDCNGVSDADVDGDGDGLKDCADFCPIQVAVTAPTGGDGSFAKPFNLIQDGIDLAPVVACYSVEVHQGTYVENIDYSGIDVDVWSNGGPDVTIIDGNAAGSVVRFATGESAAARLDGFTITNGAATEGAGIYINGADPTIVDNIIEGNATSAYPHVGGGIGMTSASPTIHGNLIRGNDAGYGLDEDGSDGGAIKIRLGSPTIYDNELTENTAGDGGAIWVAYADALIYQNLVAGNQAHDVDPEKGGQGGGVNIQIGSDDLVFTNNIVQDNVASTHGGGISLYENHASYGDGTVAQNVVAFNEVTDTSYGGGIAVWSTCAPSVYNNIVYGNEGVGAYLANTDLSWTYNAVYGNGSAYAGATTSLTGSNGNIATDPKFGGVSDDGDWTNDDWTLGSGSPAINTGAAGTYDTDGTRGDMGAYGGLLGGW